MACVDQLTGGRLPGSRRMGWIVNRRKQCWKFECAFCVVKPIWEINGNGPPALPIRHLSQCSKSQGVALSREALPNRYKVVDSINVSFFIELTTGRPKPEEDRQLWRLWFYDPFMIADVQTKNLYDCSKSSLLHGGTGETPLEWAHGVWHCFDGVGEHYACWAPYRQGLSSAGVWRLKRSPDWGESPSSSYNPPR